MPTASEVLGLMPKQTASDVLGISRPITADDILGISKSAVQPEKTQGLFGTSIGETSPLLIAAREPAKRAREGLGMLTEMIPDAETKSVTLNALLNTPKLLAEIGSEFSAGMIEPETPIFGAGLKGLGMAGKTPFGQKAIGKIGGALPDWLKRAMTYRFGQPAQYKEAAEARLGEIGKGGERGVEVGKQLSGDLSRGEQLRLGQILGGGVSTGAREANLRALAGTARGELARLGDEAVKEGILNKETYIKNLQTYMPRLYRLYEKGEPVSLPELFGTKPVKIKGERFLQRGEISESARSAMGEIKEPAFPVAKAIAQLTHDVETAKLFRQVAENPEWASDIPKEGFVQIAGKQNKMGALSGKYVHPEIARDIEEIVHVPTQVEKTLRDLNSAWKFGKTVASPGTHARNVMSNSILLDLSGVGFEEQPVLLRKSLLEIKDKGKYWKEAKDANLLGHEFVGEELKGLIDDFDRPAESVIGKVWNATKRLPSKAYQGAEQWFKLAKFIHEREGGSTVKEAVEQSEKWLFNYQKVSPFVKAARRSPVGIPFLTFTEKAIPRVLETAVENPLRLYKYKVLFDAIENVAQERLDISDKEIAQAKRNARGQVVVLPWRDKQGDLQTLDLSYILPWGDIGERGGLFGIPQAISPGGLVKPLAEAGFNKSAFFDKAIYKKTDTGTEKVQKVVDYLYKAYMPSFAPAIPGVTKGGFAFHKLKSAGEERPDYFGRVRSMPAVVADVILGLKVSPVTKQVNDALDASGLMRDRNEILMGLRGTLRNQSLTADEKVDAKNQAREKLKNLLLRKTEIEGKD